MHTYITLYLHGQSGYVKVGISVSYRNDGNQYEYCWGPGFDPGSVYAFQFHKSNISDGVWIYARGSATDH